MLSKRYESTDVDRSSFETLFVLEYPIKAQGRISNGVLCSTSNTITCIKNEKYEKNGISHKFGRCIALNRFIQHWLKLADLSSYKPPPFLF